MARDLVEIGLHWRFVAFGIECVLGAELNTREVERVFSDARTDDAGSKHYNFRTVGGVSVVGDVDEYEPETLWVSVRGHRQLERQLHEIVGNAKNQALRSDLEAGDT